MNEKKTRVALSKDQLDASLTSQIGLLMMACNSFDNGVEDSAMYIAITLRVLLHHGGHSKSLLEQLGLRSERFYSTTGIGYRPENLATTSSLTVVRLSDENAKHIAPLSNLPFPAKKVPFADWWNETVIADEKRRKMNRRELVLNIANTEAAHVDPTLDEAYMDLSRNNSLGWMFTVGNESYPLPGPHLAAVRQIAHEVLVTLREKRPHCFTRPYTH